METATRGRWTSLFDGRLSFAEEIERAVEVRSEWRAHSRQVDVIVDEIAGWLPPMWGADSEWLYLRRPEGVWKTRIALRPKADALVGLYQRRSAAVDGRRLFGGMTLGVGLAVARGWIQGSDILNPVDAGARDERSKAAASVHGDNLDAASNSWGRLVSAEGDTFTLDAGDNFCEAPHFAMQGSCLVAIDPKTGRRVAFPIGSDALLAAAESGRLSLRFSSSWFDEFIIRVPALPA